MHIKFCSNRISQVNKCCRYRNEPERFRFLWPNVWRLTGDHHTHTLTYTGDHWSCDCEYDLDNELPCGHVMALEAVLEAGVLSEEEQIVSEPMHLLLPAASPPAETILVSSCLETLPWQGSRLLWHPLAKPEASTEPILPYFGSVGPCNSHSER